MWFENAFEEKTKSKTENLQNESLEFDQREQMNEITKEHFVTINTKRKIQ